MAQDSDPSVPPALESWKDWATWGNREIESPSPYNNGNAHLCFWPSRLRIEADDTGGRWQLTVQVYQECWAPLPGEEEVWPLEVTVDGEPAVVVPRDGRPHVKLAAGLHELEGVFRWRPLPQKLAIPKQIGLISLQVNEQESPQPTWDENGDLWLRRTERTEQAKDQLTCRVYRVLQDGAPMWLHTEVELGVSGKSREETLGALLPEG
ncbi:MAG: hypothetical protein KDA37_18310, partial [Planctomycetales bacterium]|nr:hypothetical protein [Planctomycetales bacterium]